MKQVACTGVGVMANLQHADVSNGLQWLSRRLRLCHHLGQPWVVLPILQLILVWVFVFLHEWRVSLKTMHRYIAEDLPRAEESLPITAGMPMAFQLWMCTPGKH